MYYQCPMSTSWYLCDQVKSRILLISRLGKRHCKTVCNRVFSHRYLVMSEQNPSIHLVSWPSTCGISSQHDIKSKSGLGPDKTQQRVSLWKVTPRNRCNAFLLTKAIAVKILDKNVTTAFKTTMSLRRKIFISVLVVLRKIIQMFSPVKGFAKGNPRRWNLLPRSNFDKTISSRDVVYD